MTIELRIADAESQGLLLLHMGRDPGGAWRAMLAGPAFHTYSGFGETAGQALSRALLRAAPAAQPPIARPNTDDFEDLL
jgi:hypothetical protein